MLEILPPVPTDPLWALSARMKSDPRPDIIDLVVGVYRDDSGETPVMRAVAEAEARIASRSASKSYRGLNGNREFNDVMMHSILRDPSVIERSHTMQTAAGTGALRLLADFIASSSPTSTVWISSPAYVNHEPIMRRAGLQIAHYPYLSDGGGLDIDGMLTALQDAQPGDVERA